MPETPAPKRMQILRAAQYLFLRLGLRGTTMEAIAQHAGIAKPTLYKHFSDKQSVFDALVAGLVDDLRRIASDALAGSAPAAQRVANALVEKHKFTFRFLEGSPHAADLYQAPKQGQSGSLAAFDRWLKGEIVAALAAEGRTDGAMLAPLLMAAADGIALHARHAAEIGPAIRFAVARLSLAEI